MTLAVILLVWAVAFVASLVDWKRERQWGEIDDYSN